MIGGVIGIRNMIREYAATRVQVGYRKTRGDFLDASVIEIAVGISFFL
jgi:hypothetical protein